MQQSSEALVSAPLIHDTVEREVTYDAEVEALVKGHTGAVEVRVFHAFLRGPEAQRRAPGTITAPAPTVHVDYTNETGPAWFSVEDMMPDETLLLKNYDSSLDVARFSPHAAFADPTAPADILPRAGIEVRTLAIW